MTDLNSQASKLSKLPSSQKNENEYPSSTFVETMSIEAFKQRVNSETINIVRSPITQKLFFVWNKKRGDTGKVSSKIDLDNPLQSKEISIIKDDETGDTSYLLHIKHDDMANVVMSL